MTLETERVYCIGAGLVALSLCVPKEMTSDEIEGWANRENPTGISSPWAISDDETFADGHTNPCPCEQEPDARLHYLLDC